jgi:hypothetical protein
MKLKIKINNLQEVVKGTKEFSYDEEFIGSLMKPNKITLIRFSGETGDKSDTILFGTNFSSYRYSHTPTGIYGYSLNNPEILDSLRMQDLYFQNSDVIIVYWIDKDTNFNLSKDMNKSKFDDLISRLKDLIGDDLIKDALKKAEEKEAKRIQSIDSRRYIKNIFSTPDINSIRDPVEMSKIFWNIITLGSKSSKEMSLLLYKLGFKTIEDQSAIIDVSGGERNVSQAKSQSLTLSKAFIDDYEIYTNPSRYVKRGRKTRQNNPAKVEEENVKRFISGMEQYKEQLPQVAAALNNRVSIEHIGEKKFKLTLVMPSTIRKSKNFKKFEDAKTYITYGLKEDFLYEDGRGQGTSYSGVEFTDFNLIIEKGKADKLEVIFYIPSTLIEKSYAYKFLGFLYKILKKQDNVFTDVELYLARI